MLGQDSTYWLVIAGTILAAVVASAYVLAMTLRQQQAIADAKAKAERLREQLAAENKPAPEATTPDRKAA